MVNINITKQAQLLRSLKKVIHKTNMISENLIDIRPWAVTHALHALISGKSFGSWLAVFEDTCCGGV